MLLQIIGECHLGEQPLSSTPFSNLALDYIMDTASRTKQYYCIDKHQYELQSSALARESPLASVLRSVPFPQLNIQLPPSLHYPMGRGNETKQY